MRVLLMDLAPPEREKDKRVQDLALLLQALPEVSPLLLGREASPLLAFARERGMDFFPSGTGALGRFFLLRRLAWKLRGRSPQWILLCFDPEALALALELARGRECPAVVYSPCVPQTPKTLDPEPEEQMVGIAARPLPRARAVIALSEAQATELRACGFAAKDISVIPGALDPEPLPRRRPRRGGKIVFACADSLEEGKGYQILLRALAILYQDEALPPWELRIAGGGPLFAALLEEARSLKVERRMAIFGAEHGANILRECDILIVPAEAGSEGGGLSIKEGWACGLAVLCSDAPANLELIRDGRDALCFCSGDEARLAEQMRRLALDKELRRALVRAGKKRLGDYSGDAMLQKHLEIFKRLLEPGQV